MKISLYIGVPDSGKTGLAVKRVAEEITATGYPCLVLDSEEAKNLSAIRRAETIREAIEVLWGKRENIRFVPKSQEDVDKLMEAARAGGEAIILIDEFSYWISPRVVFSPVGRILRGHRHKMISVHATTQYIGDFSPVVLQCYDYLFLFRNEAGRALEKIEEVYGIPQDRVANLGPGEYVTREKWQPRGEVTAGKLF